MTISTPNFKDFNSAVAYYGKDGNINKDELKTLQKLAKENFKDDANAKKALEAGGILDGKRHEEVKVKNVQFAKSSPTEITFTVNPIHEADDANETNVIEGKNATEVINKISQKDRLGDTKNDTRRCVGACAINAAMLLGPKDNPKDNFAEAAKKIGFGTDRQDLSYQNVHEAQEAVYKGAGGKDEGKGLNQQEAIKAYKNVGLDAQHITSPPKNDEEAENAIKHIDDGGIYQVGVDYNGYKSAGIGKADGSNVNHAVLIYKDKNDGKYYMANSGATSNGGSEGARELTKDEVKTYITDNPSLIKISKPATK